MAKKQDDKSNERKENIVALTIFGAVVLVIIGISTNWFGLASQTASGGNQIVTTSVSGEPVKGEADAPITIVEYSDFECPYCGNFYRSTLKSIISQYVDSGRAKIVYKQFPLTQIHQQAMPAAIASECAHRQDKFWDMHDKLFDNQQSLTGDSYEQFAREIGLDMEQFNQCRDSDSARSEVEQDFSEGTKAGVSSTPSFVIGTEEAGAVTGELIVGAQPMTKFMEVIERQS